jgi:hypothetical protein
MWTWVERCAVAAALGGAALYVTTSLLALWLHGFRRPLWDQFRSYQLLLDAPFPRNVITAENGHRPVFPNLLKLLDLAVDGGRQGVLLAAGGVLACLAFALCAGVAWRDRALPPLWRAAGVLAAALAVFWLGNVRMLLHGNESVAVYWVLAWLACGLIALGRSERSPAAVGVAAASLALGCFGFGNGPVIGCTLLLMAVLLRRPWQQVAVLAATFAVVLLFYTVLLPGYGTSTAALALRPAENVAAALRWLSGAWVQAWIGLPDHPSGFMRAAMSHRDVGGWLIASSDWLARLDGDPFRMQMRAALWLGAAGTLLLLALSAWTLRRPGEAGATRVLGLGVAWFALGTALLVSFGRLDYFVQWPRQIFTERYVPWSSMFWLGLLLATACSLPPRIAAATAPAALIGVGLIALVLWPSHRIWIGWAATVDRQSRIFSLALAEGATLPELEPALAVPAETPTRRAVELLRRAGSSVYGPECPPPATSASTVPPLSLRWAAVSDNGLATVELRRLDGLLPGVPPDARLWVYDAGGICVGRGEITHYENPGGIPPSWRRTGADALVRVAAARAPFQVQLRGPDGTLLGVATIDGPP